MSEPLQALLQPAATGSDRFAPNSRYHGAETATWTGPDGVGRVFLRRRFLPPSQLFAELQVHAVSRGERLDQLAARYFGDPELYWRICDANDAVEPHRLTEEVGRRLHITLPEGVPGAADG